MDYTKVSDLLSGKNVFGRYSEYMESQWYSRADIYQLQATKLFRLMEHCYNHVPYYRNIMKSKGIIPSDFKDQYTLAQMPVITKETIKSNYQAFKPTNLSKIRGVKSGQTGGTTGSILVKRNDANTRSSIWGAFKRFENWMGYTSRDKALILMGGHVAHNHDFQYIKDEISSYIINAMKKQIVINPYSTDAGVTNSIISHLINSDVKLVRGYSQFLYNLCQQMKERGVSCL